MTREEAKKRVIDYISAIDPQGAALGLVDIAFEGRSPLLGALYMLEALELVKFDEDKK